MGVSVFDDSPDGDGSGRTVSLVGVVSGSKRVGSGLLAWSCNFSSRRASDDAAVTPLARSSLLAGYKNAVNDPEIWAVK